ncbi:BfmA/BtgA family mobilization protein [Autumnicola musiva]|uniref:BfmA/BtgA family mobilization protein n=1 Tax=Autumnicola musiva TaxID=3075589 RepID=A0ABU3D6P0_9FLAO|nr:BfmA/BtgA family mobilization protein [Zunongwangia sp. F117]MDT0677201.1 BfmA/BtgA family mobilization protein [Zunongwangia sp. F117]
MKKTGTFITIRFKRETAKRFQEFSKRHFKTHTEAMTCMLDFFLYNELSPKEKLGPTGRTIEQSIKKRLNAIIAIIRDMEKNKANPTLAFMQSLFEAAEPKKKPLILEKKVLKEKREVSFQEKQNHKNEL